VSGAITAALAMLSRAIQEHKFWLDSETKDGCLKVLADARAELATLTDVPFDVECPVCGTRVEVKS